MKILELEQRTDEWMQARLGIPTASNFDKIITTKGEPSKQAQKYMYRLAGERLSGTTEETYQNAAMQRGCELEDEARAFYSLINDVEVKQVGFCLSDSGYGCSPDGLIGEEGLIEIKCPQMATHVEYLIEGGLPITYFQQVQGQLLVTERKWCDFISYYAGIKPLVVRVGRNETFIKALHGELVRFVFTLNETVRKLQEK
jgi:putative phage-type endonuclease